MGDALAVLDFFGLDRVWAIGHPWGGHLALHLAVAHPERLVGILCVDPLGAYGDIFEDFGRNLRRAVSPEAIVRIREVEAPRREGTATEAELLERSTIVWPVYFARSGERAAASGRAHRRPVFGRDERVDRGPLRARHARRTGCPGWTSRRSSSTAPTMPLPPRSSIETAAPIPGARVELIEDCGHFPWMERPGELLRGYQLFQCTIVSSGLRAPGLKSVPIV